MFPNASGDAPRREGSKERSQTDEAASWQASHEKWRTFSDVRTEGLFFDVVLKSTDGNCFPAHRIILCACSPYFKSLFSGRWESGNKREISIPGVTTSVMDHILQFAYNREVTTTCTGTMFTTSVLLELIKKHDCHLIEVQLTSLQETKELLIAANHLGVEEIVRKCFTFLLDEINLWNCIDIWDFARTYYCKELEAASKSYILKHFVEISCSPPRENFQRIWNLPASDLDLFLSDDELNVVEETITFWLVIRWVSKDALNRHKFLYQLLLSIRWCSLAPDFVEDVVKKNNFVIFCKDTRRFVDFVQEQLENGGFDKNPPPTSSKRDINGNNFMSSSTSTRELMKKWATPRLPRNLILVVGGWCGDSPSNSSELYEPRRKKWRKINKSFPPILKRPRAYHSVLYHEGFMYVIGGYDGHNTYNSCDRYDVERCQWQEMCGMHSRRCYVGVAFMDECIYAFGGSDGSEAARLKTAEKFYPSRNVWKRLPDMLERRSDAGACSLGRRLYVAGGFTGQECVVTVEYFDPESSQWSHVTRMTVARSGVSVVAYRGRVVVLGGYDGHNRLRSAEAFDPESNEWSMMSPMKTMRSNFTACVIEGRLLVMGGFNGVSTCADVEYYDDVCRHCGMHPCSRVHIDEVLEKSSNLLPCISSHDSSEDNTTSSDDLDDGNLASPLSRGDERSGETWKSLPKMRMSRSALSCCVLTGISPKYLKSLIEEEET